MRAVGGNDVVIVVKHALPSRMDYVQFLLRVTLVVFIQSTVEV